MAREPPHYFKRDAENAAAEHLAFMDAAPEAASKVFAEFCMLQTLGAPADIPRADDRVTDVRDLYCRKLKHWALFYTADLPPKPFRIHVLHVAPLAGGFDAAQSVATGRLRRLQTGD